MLQKNSFECKSFFGEKGVAILFQINPFGSSLWIFLKISKNLLYNLLFRAFSHKKFETLMKTNFVNRVILFHESLKYQDAINLFYGKQKTLE